MIDVHNLTKHYGPVRAVDDLTFTVKPGVVTGFLGPNGAGKTTCFYMIVGLVPADAGRIVLDGTDSFASRQAVNAACVAASVPLIAGAIAQWEGQVALYDPARGGPCLACLFPEAPAPVAPPASLPNPPEARR